MQKLVKTSARTIENASTVSEVLMENEKKTVKPIERVLDLDKSDPQMKHSTIVMLTSNSTSLIKFMEHGLAVTNICINQSLGMHYFPRLLGFYLIQFERLTSKPGTSRFLDFIFIGGTPKAAFENEKNTEAVAPRHRNQLF